MKRPAKILLLATHPDWANVGYEYGAALRSVGVHAVMVQIGDHVFGYPEHGVVVDSPEKALDYLLEADIVTFMHSSFVDFGWLIKKKRLFVFHGGSIYRQDPDGVNELFNPIVEKSIIQTGDLLGLGAKNEIWVLPPVNTHKISPVYESKSDKPVFAHYPSSRYKGTDGIADAVERVRSGYGASELIFECSREIVRWEDNIRRMAECDVYVDAVAPLQGQRRYGEWGVQALEAAALGKVVIAHFGSGERYARDYGLCPISVANTKAELEERVRECLKWWKDGESLATQKKKMREWVETYHSYEAIGKRLKEQVYEL